MKKVCTIVLGIMLSHVATVAQHSAAAAYEKFTDLTRMFHGSEPYSCYAIVDVKYRNTASGALRDTSTLIYRNGSTYYRSKLVERVEASEGELIINHELKTASFHLSDSIRQLVLNQLDIERETEMESLLDSSFEEKDLRNFNDFMLNQCNVTWEIKEGLEEISFIPKKPAQATLLAMKIRFGKDSKVRYYEYTNREVYATDWNGKSLFRVVTTIYDKFEYDNVPNIPSRLSDFLRWNGWVIKLKKYTNYKLSVL